MSPRWFDREEELLERDLADGSITQGEYRAAIRDMRRELEDAACESAQEAYNREFE